ncbi:PVRL1 [Mytilus coruscus]|uniref:PVRL1 n=1 Tax=Mytilus coruscus TaxID=42192 RepID=A0A6J8DSB7_MYTCO|nr:PVRL1 [Mytilus coruscus]
MFSAGIKNNSTVYVLEGATAILECNVPPNVKSTWDKDNSNSSKRYVIPYADGREINKNLPNLNNLAIVGEISEGNYNLQIQNVSSSDEGVYICSHLSIDSGAQESNVTLQVKVKPTDIKIIHSINGIVHGEEGKSLNLTCTVKSGIPPEEIITWYNMSSLINTGGPGMLSVLITPSRNDHRTQYNCNVTSDSLHQPLQKNITLDIRYKPSVTINNPNPIVVTENNNLTISCSSDGNPSVKDMHIENGTRHVLNRCNKFECSVAVLKIKREEAGFFTCVARNIIGMGEDVVKITVQYPPSVIITLAQEESVLHCIPDGNPSHYTFHFWEHRSNFGQTIRMLGNNQDLQLQRSDQMYQMNGIYVCRVENGVKDINGSTIQVAETHVQYTDRPIIVARNAVTQYGRFGFPVNIKVHVYSFPEITDVTVNILKHGKSRAIKNKYISIANSTLTDTIFNKEVQINGYTIILQGYNLSKHDFTSYEFRIINKIGEAVHLVKLSAADFPEKPKIIKVVADMESLTVYWNSTFNGGKQQQFILEYKTVDTTEWNKSLPINDTSVDCCHHVLQHLEANTNYMIRIVANNEIGSSNFSNIHIVKTLACFVCKTQFLRNSYVQDREHRGEMSVENFIYQSQERSLESRLQHTDPDNHRSTDQHLTTALLQGRNETPYQNHCTLNSTYNQACFEVENSIYQSQTSNALDRMQHCLRTCKHSSQETRLSNRLSNINGMNGQFSERIFNRGHEQDNEALHYVEVVFDPLNHTNEAHIHGINDRTIYADIDTGAVGMPLEESDEENNEDDDDDFMYIDGIIDYTKKSSD